MYEPTDATFIVDFISVVITIVAYLVILTVTVKLRAPSARSMKDAADTLASLARTVDWRRTKIALAAGVLLLTALGSIVAYSSSDALHVFIFRLNDERTIPTFYNTVQLFVAATLALLLARESQKTVRLAWIFFAIAFVGAGIDETADMHARFALHTGLSEELALAPVIIIMLAALAILWRPLRASGPALPLLFAGGILIVVSQGFDLNHAKWSQRIVEEALELGACALFVLSMLAAIRTLHRGEPPGLLRDRTRFLRYSQKTDVSFPSGGQL